MDPHPGEEKGSPAIREILSVAVPVPSWWRGFYARLYLRTIGRPGVVSYPDNGVKK